MTDARLRGMTLTVTIGYVTDALIWQRAVILWPAEVHISKKQMAPLKPMSLKRKRRHGPKMAQTQGYSFKTHASPPSSPNVALPPWNPVTMTFLI